MLTAWEGRGSWEEKFLGFYKTMRSIHILKSGKKTSLYFRAPPNFVHLPYVVPPSSNFPSALFPVVPHFFSFDNYFFLIETLFFSTQPVSFLHYLEFYANSHTWGSYISTHVSILSLGCCLFITYIFPFSQYLSGHVSFSRVKTN